MPDRDSVPTDMRDLLIRLDQRVADGFEGVNQKLAQMDKRADNLEARVADLEKASASRPILIKQHDEMMLDVDALKDWRTNTEGQMKGAETSLKWMKHAALAIIAALGYLGWQVGFHQTAPATVPTTKIEVQGGSVGAPQH